MRRSGVALIEVLVAVALLAGVVVSLAATRVLAKFLFGFICTSYVFEGDSGLVASEHARPRFTEREGCIIAALRLAEYKPENAGQDHKRQHVTHDGCNPKPGAGGAPAHVRVRADRGRL